MNREDLMRLRAVDISARMRNELMTIYERNNIPDLNGFQLNYQTLCNDLEGLSNEIYDLMSHPRKYKAMLKLFCYIQNM